VDTSATHHTCYDLKWFISYTKIEPIVVNLPNGSTIGTHCRGQVKLYDDFSIDNVLYLPQFVVNLISVPKLCQKQNCILQFEDDACTIQEKKDWFS